MATNAQQRSAWNQRQALARCWISLYPPRLSFPGQISQNHTRCTSLRDDSESEPSRPWKLMEVLWEPRKWLKGRCDLGGSGGVQSHTANTVV